MASGEAVIGSAQNFIDQSNSLDHVTYVQYMSIKCHHTVTGIILVLLSHYCGVQLTTTPITVKTTVELL